ncbi:MAG TPA: hypothetical protein VMV77_03445 [Bacteroidales bacterium]|nr:hypothetical protein [Bacteroidales bacterium]
MENTVIVKELLDQLYICEKQLTSGQMNFIHSCKKEFTREKTLSEKQIAVLKEIRKFLPDQEPRFSGSTADKKTYVHDTHFKMPKIRYNNKRSRRVKYQGIIGQQPELPTDEDQLSIKLNS